MDSVNSVVFQPFSNHMCTCSGDKTISMWDCRTGLCIQTFYGHTNACNHATFNLRGDCIASTDADGIVKFWDVRMVSERLSVAVGQYPANKAAFDASCSIVAVGCEDGAIRIVDANEGRVLSSLTGHEDSVHCVAFDAAGQFLVSCSSDGTARLWS